MFLGYLDDSKRCAKKDDPTVSVLSLVLVRDGISQAVEHVVGQTILEVVPPDRFDQFEEFKACELYGGYGVFDGVAQETRFEAIKTLLHAIDTYRMPIMFGAVDLQRLSRDPYASADPLDVAFRLIVPGIEKLMGEDQYVNGPQFCLLIADEMDKSTKKRLKESFRSLRKKIRPPTLHPGTWYLHDDMYFGDSRDSVGLQLADLCGFFIAKKCEKDEASSGFFDIFRSHIVHKRMEPNRDSVDL
jgi:hypothetical protein